MSWDILKSHAGCDENYVNAKLTIVIGFVATGPASVKSLIAAKCTVY